MVAPACFVVSGLSYQAICIVSVRAGLMFICTLSLQHVLDLAAAVSGGVNCRET